MEQAHRQAAHLQPLAAATIDHGMPGGGDRLDQRVGGSVGQPGEHVPQILERALGQARQRFGHAALSQALEVAAPPRRSSSSEPNNSSSDTLSTTVPMALISGVTPRRTEAKM